MAGGVVSTAQMLYPDSRQIAYLSIEPDMNPDDFQKEIDEKVKEVDTGDGVIIMADLFGGTPCNRAIYSMNDKVHILSGLNLPMLLTALMSRNSNDSIDKLICEIIQEAKEGILHVNEQLMQLRGKEETND